MAVASPAPLPRIRSTDSVGSLGMLAGGGFSFYVPQGQLPRADGDIPPSANLVSIGGLSTFSVGSLGSIGDLARAPPSRTLSWGRMSIGTVDFSTGLGAGALTGTLPEPLMRSLSTSSFPSGPHWLDQPRSNGRSVGVQMPGLAGYASDEEGFQREASTASKEVLPVLPVVPILTSPPPAALSPLSATRPLKRGRALYEKNSEAVDVLPVAPPGGAPDLARPTKAPRRRYRAQSATSVASAASTVSSRAQVVAVKRGQLLPPPPTFFDPKAPMDDKTYFNLEKRVHKLVHGPPDRKLGKYYGAQDWCCERCRNIFKDHTKPFKRPAHDVRSVLRKLRLQACVDVGMRGYATDTSGNFNNHNSKSTPLARDHECATGRRTLELFNMIRGAPVASAQ